MGTFKSFEEMEVWQRSRALANKIFKMYQEGNFSKDFKLRDQMNGSSGSIMDNIAEGFERNGNREFIQFLAIAKGSAGEFRSQLYRALDRCYLSETAFAELIAETFTIGKLLSGLIRYLNSTNRRGAKFPNTPLSPKPKPR